MRPPNLIFDATYMILKNSIFFSYYALQSIVLSYSKNLFSCKFCIRRLFSAIRSLMLYSIGLIIGSSIPPKILQIIVFRISVVMAALHPIFGMASKCNQYESMDFEQFIGIVIPKHKSKPAIFGIWSGLFHFSRSAVSNAAKIRNLIRIFITYNVFPNFIHKIFSINQSGNIGILN